ncbi:MAG: PhzF family phenazine biosynthesis protein [Christensenellales bacterium]
MKYYVVDAFAKRVFSGNPAGVCIVDMPLQARTMQNIAAENNLSETAFVQKRDDGAYNLRWFTPKAEIDLCGHATLGTAFVVSKFLDSSAQIMSFHTKSGVLAVRREGSMFEMDFPSRPPKAVQLGDDIDKALGVSPVETYASRDLLLVLENETQVNNLAPDFESLKAVREGLGVIVTAKGDKVDFVSRCFYPKLGINEDPVTGSAHCHLIPFWAQRLHKSSMVAKQLSRRGGTVYCKLAGDRVIIGGTAVLYSCGEIEI